MPVALLNIDSIINRLNAIWTDGVFLSKNSIKWHSIEKDISNIKKNDPASGWLLQGMLESAAGDIDAVRYCFNNLNRLDNTAKRLIEMVSSYHAVGLATEALNIYKQVGIPEKGEFSLAFKASFFAGAFNVTAKFYKECVEKSIDVHIDEDILNIHLNAANLLAERGISDETVASQIDIVGEVFRERNELFPYNCFFEVNGILKWVTMRIKVIGNPSEYLDALISKEAERNFVKIPAFDVEFVRKAV